MTVRRVDPSEKKVNFEKPAIEMSFPKKQPIIHAKPKDMKKVPARINTGLEDISRNNILAASNNSL